MKTNSFYPLRRRNRGSAVLVLMVFLGLMMILTAATTAVEVRSQKEVALIEQRQLAHWATVTNAPAPARAITAP